MKRFKKSFTQQEPIPQQGIDKVVEILKSGRLHRYNTAADEISETALLEEEYAAYQDASYCLAVASGGQAIQIALRAVGVEPGDKILANAYTLAPVPGAIHAVGAAPVFVEIGDDWLTDIDDLRAKAHDSDARFLMLSHMRGHIANMDAVCDICDEFNIVMIEDCAHTMGAQWKGRKSGNFGKVACFSTQTYKHMNSGEGGLLTTDDGEIAARATILSGSYMLYERHGASPSANVFEDIRLQMPNCSARMDNLRAAILRAQLPRLDDNVRRWNERYRILEDGLRNSTGIRIVERPQHESYVGSSIQFHIQGISVENIPTFIDACFAQGVELKWFGSEQPAAFTSRYDSWHYIDDIPHLPKTLKSLSTTCDMRVPLTFDNNDCEKIAAIIVKELENLI
ncbi:MAG: DegT/DnrJ/EryC1/StrS family aminotransferase [Methyloligellaceae bacterium]